MVQSIYGKIFARTLIVLGLFVLSSTAFAHESDEKTASFSVTGRGVIIAEPDIAFIRSGVLTEAKTAEEALFQNTQKMTAIFDLLGAEGIKKTEINTRQFTVEPQYRYHNPRPGEARKPPEIIGYSVRNQISVKVSDLANLGTILSKLVGAGSNELDAITFDVSEREKKLNEARRLAFKDAKEKAQLYMQAAGLELGKMIHLEEAGVHPSPQRNFTQKRALEAAATFEAAPVPVVGGSTEIAIEVTVSWQIAP